MDKSGPQNVSGVRIVDNVFRDLWKMGIQVSVEPGTQIRNVLISNNDIENVGAPSASGAYALFFRGALATESLPAGEAIDTLVSNNRIFKVQGVNAIGLLVTYYPSLTFSGNAVSDVDDAGVQAIGAKDLWVTANSVARTGRIGMLSRGAGSVCVRDNVFVEWGVGGERAAGVSVDDATAGDVLNNVFRSKDIRQGRLSVSRFTQQRICTAQSSLCAHGASGTVCQSGRYVQSWVFRG